MRRLRVMAQKALLLCFFAVGCTFGIAAQLQCHERDEVAAGRNCERACRTDGTCRKQNRDCICDGLCGPVCLRKTCPPLTQPGNGSVTIDPSGRFIGSEAMYLCNNGFEVVGNAARICQANKMWSGTNPTCQTSIAPVTTTPVPATCGRLPSPLNGRTISVQEDGDVVVQDTVARFQCDDGYAMTSGNLRRICREDGSWSGSDVVCSAAQLQCQHERDEVAAGRNCERACRPDGACKNQNRECICDGRCGPVCLRKTCPLLTQPGNGSTTIDPSGRFIGSEATYLCDDGFEVVGNAVRICQANKTWSGTDATCQKSLALLFTRPIQAKLQCQHERDEVAAGRNCERACQPDGTCRKQNRECICDGRCGPVCLRKSKSLKN